MGKFDHAFDPPEPSDPFAPPTPEQLARHGKSSALAGVQTSLYANLKWRYPAKSGAVAWYLIRLIQPEHRDHQRAVWAIEQRDVKDVEDLMAAVKKTAASPKANDEWRALCTRIKTELAKIGMARLQPVLDAQPRKPKTYQTLRNKKDGGTADCPIAGVDAYLASGEWELA